MIKKLKGIYETKAIFFIGFLISYPLVLVALNSMPVIMAIERAFALSLIVWIVVFFIKPINKLLSRLLLFIQLVWFFSGVYLLDGQYKMGLDHAFYGSTKLAAFVYHKLFGQEYFLFINWLKNFLLIKDYEVIRLYYNIFNVFIIFSVMMMVMTLIEKRVNWKVFLFVSSYFIMAWFFYVADVKSYFSMYFLGITIYRQYDIYDHQVKTAKEKGERTRYYNYTSAILVGSILMTLVLIISNVIFLLMPLDKVNANINRVIPKTNLLRSDYKTLKSSKIFNFNSTMYAPENDLLGGPITDRDYSVIMRVRAKTGPLYLRGRVKNIYDGSKWTSDFDTFKNNINLTENKIEQDQLEEIIVYPDTLSSRTIFTPYKYYSSSFLKSLVYGNEDTIVYRKNKSNVSLERYSVQYIKAAFISQYDTFDENLRDKYLKVPPSGLTKTKNLTAEITRGVESDYQKMILLEQYLRDNYKYSLMTDEVNPELDFVENFLFDEKKGYCTYFASALALMGRFSDIPTRYVEGYVTSDFADYQGFYEVSANRAHAWVEAYIEGRGWSKFEPTPAYLSGVSSEDEKTFDDLLEVENGITDEEYDEERRIQKEENLEALVKESTNSKMNDSGLLIRGIYLVILLGVLYMIYCKIKRYKRDIYYGDFNTKIKNRIKYILSMIALFDEEMDVTALPTHVIARTSSNYLNISVDKNILNYINLSLYGDCTFSQEDFDEFNAFFIYYESRVKSKISRISYYMNKFISNTLYHNDYYKE